MTEQELAERCRQGDREAQRELYAQTCDSIYRLLLRMTHHRDEALDLTQATYLRAFQNIHQFDGASRLSSWVYRIAMNEALQFLRQRRRHAGHLRTIAESAGRPTGGDPDARLDVAEALARLSAEDRALIVLRHFEGLSYEEMAAALGKPAGTIASGLNRARRALRELLGDEPEGGR